MQQIFPLDVQQFSARRAMIVTIVDYEEKKLTSNLVKQKKQGKMRKSIQLEKHKFSWFDPISEFQRHTAMPFRNGTLTK